MSNSAVALKGVGSAGRGVARLIGLMIQHKQARILNEYMYIKRIDLAHEEPP